MAIGNLSELASFLVDLTKGSKSSNNYGSQISNLARSSQGVGKGLETAPGQLAKQQEVEIQPVEDAPVEISDTPAASEPSTPAEQPSAPSSDSTTTDSLRELAILYVEQYEQGANKALTEEDFNTRVDQVTQLYSSVQDGKERLDKIVFSNDGKDTDIQA